MRRQRDWGIRRALYWYLMTRLARLGVRVNYVFVASPLANRDYIELPDGYVNRAVSLEELAPFVDKVDGLDAAFFALAVAHDDWCIASFFHDQLVGYSFLSHSRTLASKQLDIIVPDGFSYSYKSWTDPEHRLARLSSSRLYHSNIAFPDSKRSFYYVETHNYASLLRGYRPLSQRRIHAGYIGWFTWFGRQIPFASRRALWLGVEFVPRGETRERYYA
ncbi:MAG: hypothetical protein AAF993_03235 [Pseudomonadota bacterium]